MTRSDRAAEVFGEALERPSAERVTFVDAACASDPELREEVLSLLAAHADARHFLATPLLAAGSRSLLETLAEREVGREVGAYRLTRWLASGGMGAVYQAERTDDAFQKQVAVKLLRPDRAHDDLPARFRAERQVLADLEHPGIARLLDGGTTADGLPYIVMEYIDGVPIDAWCDAHGLDVPARLRLFLAVCDAVQYAHHHLVIHRDLKPANILIDREGSPHLVDFGIARVVEPAAAPAGGAFDAPTQMAALTPAYASPEQILGRRISTATDIYSLGVVLYRLLTGTLPHDMTGLTPYEMGRRLLETEPPRPSGAASDPRRAAVLRGDLDAILRRALHREPERRYPTVDELAADLRRHLAGQPVLARPDSATYRLRRFARRNRALVTGVTAAFALLAAAFLVTLAEYREARRRGGEAEWLGYTSALAAAESSLLRGQVAEARRHLENAPARLRGWEWRHLEARLDRSLRAWRAHADGITRLAFVGDGHTLVSASIDSTVRVWDVADGSARARYGPFRSTVESVAVDSAGAVIVVGLHDGGVLRLHTTGARVDTLAPRGTPFALVALSPDGSTVAAGFADGGVRAWGPEESAAPLSWPAHAGLAVVALADEGRTLVTAGSDGVVRVWDVVTGMLRHEMTGDRRRVYTLVASPRGDRVLTGTTGGTATVWDLTSGRPVSVFGGHEALISSGAFHPDGTRVVTSATDGQVLVWEAATGARVTALRGNAADVSALAASSDGAWIAAGDWDGMIRVWRWSTADVRTVTLPPARDGFRRPRRAAMAGGGHTLAIVTSRGELLTWDLERVGMATRPDSVPGAPARLVAGTPGSPLLAAAGDDGMLAVIDPVVGQMRSSRRLPGGGILAMALDAAGRRLATATADSVVHLLAFPGLDAAETPGLPRRAYRALAFLPGGALVAALPRDSILVADAVTGRLRRALVVPGAAILDVAASPDGRRLAAATTAGLCGWSTTDGEPLPVAHPVEVVTALAFSPDGTRLAIGGPGPVVRLLEADTLREILALHGHTARIVSLGFTGDGRSLVSGAADGVFRAWDTGP